MNDSDAPKAHRTWVQVRFYQDTDLGQVNHVWTAELDYNFYEIPQPGDAVIVRGFERDVIPSGVNEDGSIDFMTRFEGKAATVPLEVTGRAWLAEGVLLITVPFDHVGPDEHEKAETLLHALDVMGFKSSSNAPEIG